VRDDDCALALREEREESTCLESINDRIQLISRGSFLLPAERSEGPTSAASTTQRDAKEPARQVLARRRRTPKPFRECLVKSVLGELRVAEGRQKRAIHTRYGVSVEGRPVITCIHYYK
jgi:hypothetical protein